MFSWEIYGFFRSTHRRCFMKKAVLEDVLKNFAIFKGKFQACNFIKSTLQHTCFPLNIAKFLRTPISKNICSLSSCLFHEQKIGSCEIVCLRFKFKIFKAVPKNNPRAHSLQQNKKSRVDNSCLFQSLYSRKVAETIIALCLTSFTKIVFPI